MIARRITSLGTCGDLLVPTFQAQRKLGMAPEVGWLCPDKFPRLPRYLLIIILTLSAVQG